MKTFSFGILFFFISVATAYSASSVNVPIDDPAYRNLDKLIAFGLIKDAIYGQRPWSRKEIVRLIEEALKNGRSLSIKEALDNLQDEFQDDLKKQNPSFTFKPLEKIDFQYTILDSPYRDVPGDGGQNIDASINPLVSYRNGLPYANGSTFSLGSSGRATLSKYLSISFAPTFRYLVFDSGSHNEGQFRLQNLYGKTDFGNFSIELGRDQVIFGQGKYGGLLLSNNARPLDMFKIGNEAPFLHPWIFKHLGPSKYTLFIANMGPEREFPYSFLIGWKGSVKPWPNFEMGFTNVYFMGGENAPPMKWYDPLSELFLFRAGGAFNKKNVADHRISLDLRLRTPTLSNATFYLEIAFEDFGFFPDVSYWEDRAAYQFGVLAPSLGPTGKLSLNVEYHHSSTLFGRHGLFISGHTLNRHILGDELGPSGNLIHLETDYLISQKTLLKTSAEIQFNDSDLEESFHQNFIKVADNPSEKRYRFLGSFEQSFSKARTGMLTLGYERVSAFRFVPGHDRNNWLGELAFTIRFPH